MYDTTVFVAATIESVKHTLIEAFVLVAIVVFVFLGNLRATLIPIIAVPVALIGTFAVMLALGFSANTVSLLALVLAIGIVVDDAIVVVEAVEHILEHEPRPHAGRGDREGDDPGHRRRSSPSPWCCSRSSCRRPSFPASPASSTSSSPSPCRSSMVISAINALSLSPALCSLILRHRGKPRGVMAWLQNGIDRTPRRLCRGWSRRWRGAASSPCCWSACSSLGAGGLARIVPTGFLPDEDQGAFMAEVQLPDAASTNRTAGGAAAGREHVRRQAVAAEPVHRLAATACSTASPCPTARWSWRR